MGHLSLSVPAWYKEFSVLFVPPHFSFDGKKYSKSSTYIAKIHSETRASGLDSQMHALD